MCEKILYFIKVTMGMSGRDGTHLVRCTPEQLDDVARDLALENAEMYGFYTDPDHFGDNEQDYTNQSTIDWYSELYDPDTHMTVEYCVPHPRNTRPSERLSQMITALI